MIATRTDFPPLKVWRERRVVARQEFSLAALRQRLWSLDTQVGLRWIQICRRRL